MTSSLTLSFSCTLVVCYLFVPKRAKHILPRGLSTLVSAWKALTSDLHSLASMHYHVSIQLPPSHRGLMISKSHSLLMITVCIVLLYFFLHSTYSCPKLYYLFVVFLIFHVSPRMPGPGGQGPWLSYSLLQTHSLEQCLTQSRWSTIFVEWRNTLLSLSSEIW